MDADPTSELSFDDVFDDISAPAPYHTDADADADADVDMLEASTSSPKSQSPNGLKSSHEASLGRFRDDELRIPRGRRLARRSKVSDVEDDADGSGFYVIDVIELKKHSKRPHFLEERLASRKSSVHLVPDGSDTPPRSHSPEHRDESPPRLFSSLDSPPASPDLGESRRQRVIEARRAKLQRRLNHVQEVHASQRRKLESSAHSIRSNLTHRFEEAERARNEIMSNRAERASAAASRAKEVSRLAHERAQEESAKRRKQVEEKLQLSESRRNMLMASKTGRSTPRRRGASSHVGGARRGSRSSTHSATSASLDSSGNSGAKGSSSKPLLEPAAAVSMLQGWFRYHRIHPLVRNLLTRRLSRRLLSTKSLAKMPFRDVVKGMQEVTIIKSVTRLLQKCFAVGIPGKAGKGTTTAEKRTEYKNPARVFLSAWMVVGHPNELLQEQGAEEQDLLAFASKLTETFRRLASHQSYSAAFSKDLFEFLAAYDAFYSKFDAWKRRDTDRVIDHLVAHWIDLERLWLSVKDQPHADDMWSEKIDRQQRDIQEKLRKLAGQAGLERLAEARRNAISRTPDDDAVMAESRSPSPSPHSGASSPRVPSTPIGSSSPTNLHTVDDMSSSPKTFPSSLERWAQQRKKDSVTNSRRSSPAPGTAGPSSRERAVPEIHPSEGQEVRDRATSSSPVPDVSSPRASARVNEEFNALFKGFGHGGMSNEALAHEVLLDPDFKLKPPKRTDLEERIHLMTRKAFFDQVRDDFNSKIFGHLLPLIKDIKEGLLSLVSEKGSIHREIDASLDLVLIQQQVSRNSADIKRYILFVIEKMLQLCAPIRDQEIRNLRDVLDADAVGAIEGVLSTLEHMKLDLANYRLTELRPYLAKEAVTYERNKFAFALNRVDVTLERTRQWLNSAAQSLQSVAASRNPEGIEVMPHTAIRFEDVFVEGLMTLVFSRTAVSRETVPETMLLDVERLFAFQNDAQAVTVIASLVMLCKNVVTELRTDETGVKILSKTISVLLDGGAEGVTTDHLGLQVVSSMRSFLQSKGKSLSQEQEGVLKQMVEKTLSYRDAVFNLIARRIQEKVRQQLQTGMFPRQTLVSSGLDCVAEELEKLSRKIYMLGKHNKEVFSPYYDEIIRESLGLLG